MPRLSNFRHGDQGIARTATDGVTADAIVISHSSMTGREALLEAFDHLFDAAAEKLHASCTAEERAEARNEFAQRFAQVLDMTRAVEVREMPPAVLDDMKAAIGRLSTADLAGMIASVPLAHQTQEMLRTLAVRDAERKLLHHLASQADTRYGGN